MTILCTYFLLYLLYLFCFIKNSNIICTILINCLLNIVVIWYILTSFYLVHNIYKKLFLDVIKKTCIFFVKMKNVLLMIVITSCSFDSNIY